MNKLLLNLFLIISFFLYYPVASSAQIRYDFVLSDSAGRSSIRVDEAGNIYAIWTKRDTLYGAPNPVYFALFDSLGYNIKAPARVSGSRYPNIPRFDISLGHAAITWSVRSATWNDYIYGYPIDLAGAIEPGGVRFNSDYGDANRGGPDVAYLNDTTFIIVWAGHGPETPSEFGVYGQISTNSLSFLGGNILLTDQAPPGVFHLSARIVTRPSMNDFIVVWHSDESGSRRVYGRYFNMDGSPMDSSFLISEDPHLTDLWYLSAAGAGSGKFAVVWGGEIDSSEWVIQMRFFNADGTPVTPSIMVNSPEIAGKPLGLNYPDISFDYDGSFVVVWEHEIEDSWRIYGQRYLSDGSPLGGNFRVSLSGDTLKYAIPSVVLQNSKIYTSWSSSKGLGQVMANIIDFHNPPLGLQERKFSIPGSFYLRQNYPNPFNATTLISYSIPVSGHVSLSVYNIIGQRVALLVNEEKAAGKYTVHWDASTMASGIYIYTLRSGASVETKKMLLLK